VQRVAFDQPRFSLIVLAIFAFLFNYGSFFWPLVLVKDDNLRTLPIGLMAFDWQPLPADPVLLVHLALVAALMIVFPVSKLLHAPGVFFSPSLNQVDDARERRHAAGWSTQIVHVSRAPVGRAGPAQGG